MKISRGTDERREQARRREPPPRSRVRVPATTSRASAALVATLALALMLLVPMWMGGPTEAAAVADSPAARVPADPPVPATWKPAVTWGVGNELEGSSSGWLPLRQADYWENLLGAARYGDTYLFCGESEWNTATTMRWRRHGTIQATPFRFTLPPTGSQGPAPLGNPLLVLHRDTYDRFVGVCEIGSPQPDIWAFYTKSGEPTKVFWRQHTEHYNTEHGFTWPGGRAVNDVLGCDDADRQQSIGSVVAFGGGIAFVTADPVAAGTVTITTVDPADGRLIARTDIAANVPALTSVDACAVTSHGTTTLAVGFIGGAPGTPAPAFECFGFLDSAVGELLFVDAALHVVSQAEVPLYCVPTPTPPKKGFAQVYRPRDIALVQGSVDGATSGDALQVFTRGGWVGNPYYARQSESLGSNKYVPINWTTVGRFGWSLDTGGWSDASATPGGVWEYEDKMMYSAFDAFPVLGPLSHSSQDEYYDYRQYLMVDATAKLNKGSIGGGYLTGFASDFLRAIKDEISPQTGKQITYPHDMQLTDDAAGWQLLGVVYGPPPFSLQGYDYPDLKSPSRFSFAHSHSAATSTQTTMGGSVTASEKFVIGGFEQTFGLTQTQTGKATFGSNVNFSFRHDTARKADMGYLICSRPEYEVQAYTRQDWAGAGVPDSHLFVTRCTNRAQDQTVTYVPIDMVKPDGATASKGMTAHARSADFSNTQWRMDPEARPGAAGNWTRLSKVLLTADLDGGSTTAALTQGKEQAIANGETVKLAAKWPYFSSEFTYAVTSTSTTGDANNTEVFLDLAAPKAGATGTLARRLEVEASWLQADTTAAYWIPEAFRTGGNGQRPWCIDYRVVSWLPYDDAAAARAADAAPAGDADAAGNGAGSADAAARDADAGTTCSVAPDTEPAAGGTATVGGSETAVEVPAGTTVALRARPADGYAFVRWVAHGEQIGIAKRSSRATTVTVNGGGGATVEAVFRPLLPRSLSVRERSADRYDLRLIGAFLPTELRAPADPAGMDVAVRIGGLDLACPAGAWQRSGDVYTASWQPQGWQRSARCTLRIDQGARSWKLSVVKGEDAQDVLLDCADGNVVIGIALNGALVTRAPVPIGARSRIVPSARSAGRYPLDLSQAQATTSCSHSSMASRFAVTGVKASPRLLSAKGFTVTLNGHIIDVGPFVRHGNLWTYSGRTDGGARVLCRYRTDGRLDLILSGAALRGQLDQLIGQNIAMEVSRGKLSAQGNLIAEVKTLSVTGTASAER